MTGAGPGDGTTRVLLFGATGFVGQHVRPALAADPRVGEIACPGRRDIDLYGGQVTALTALLRTYRPHAVVNCAGALAGGAYELVRANTAVTAKLVEAIAEAAPGARFVRLGSAAEYGPVPHGRSAWEDAPPRPVSPYGVSHLAGTQLVEVASATGLVDGAVLRVFNPIGPGLSGENLLGRVATLIRLAAGEGLGHITVGPLGAYRDFVDVRDLAAAVVAAALAPALPHRVFNVGSGRAVTARDAVRLLAVAAGFTGAVREAGAPPPRSAAVTWIRADVGRAARVLGWSPKYTLAESVADLWAGVGAGTPGAP